MPPPFGVQSVGGGDGGIFPIFGGDNGTPKPPLIDSYSDSYYDPTKRTQRDFGEDRVRLMTGQPPALITAAWELTEEEYHTFDIWYWSVIKNGALRFDVRLADREGDLLWYTVQIVGVYNAEKMQPGSGFNWRVSVTLLSMGDPFVTRSAPAILGTRMTAAPTILPILSKGMSLGSIMGIESRLGLYRVESTSGELGTRMSALADLLHSLQSPIEFGSILASDAELRPSHEESFYMMLENSEGYMLLEDGSRIYLE